jgi:hypothetical protein
MVQISLINFSMFSIRIIQWKNLLLQLTCDIQFQAIVHCKLSLVFTSLIYAILGAVLVVLVLLF